MTGRRLKAHRPDAALLRPRPEGYARSLPTARDIILVLEVSDTTTIYDRNVTVPLYGVPSTG